MTTDWDAEIRECRRCGAWMNPDEILSYNDAIGIAVCPRCGRPSLFEHVKDYRGRPGKKVSDALYQGQMIDVMYTIKRLQPCTKSNVCKDDDSQCERTRFLCIQKAMELDWVSIIDQGERTHDTVKIGLSRKGVKVLRLLNEIDIIQSQEAQGWL